MNTYKSFIRNAIETFGAYSPLCPVFFIFFLMRFTENINRIGFQDLCACGFLKPTHDKQLWRQAEMKPNTPHLQSIIVVCAYLSASFARTRWGAQRKHSNPIYYSTKFIYQHAMLSRFKQSHRKYTLFDFCCKSQSLKMLLRASSTTIDE